MDALRAHYPAARFYYFAEEHVGKQESFDCRPPEPPPPDIIMEHGLKFRNACPAATTRRGSSSISRDNRKTFSEFCGGSAC